MKEITSVFDGEKCIEARAYDDHRDWMERAFQESLKESQPQLKEVILRLVQEAASMKHSYWCGIHELYDDGDGEGERYIDAEHWFFLEIPSKQKDKNPQTNGKVNTEFLLKFKWHNYVR